MKAIEVKVLEVLGILELGVREVIVLEVKELGMEVFQANMLALEVKMVY